MTESWQVPAATRTRIPGYLTLQGGGRRYLLPGLPASTATLRGAAGAIIGTAGGAAALTWSLRLAPTFRMGPTLDRGSSALPAHVCQPYRCVYSRNTPPRFIWASALRGPSLWRHRASTYTFSPDVLPLSLPPFSFRTGPLPHVYVCLSSVFPASLTLEQWLNTAVTEKRWRELKMSRCLN